MKLPKLRSPVPPPFSCCPLLVPTLIHALAPAPPPPLWSRPLQRIPLLRTFLRATSLLAPPPLFWSRPPALRPRPSASHLLPPLLHRSSPARGWSSGVSSRSALVCGWAGWLPGGPEMDAVAAGGAVRGLRNPWSNPLQRKKGWLPSGAFLFCAAQNTIERPQRSACSGGRWGWGRCPGLHPAEAGLHVAAPDPPCRARSSASGNSDPRARYRPSIISGPTSFWMLLRGLLEFEALTWLPACASRYLTALPNRCARL